MIRVTIEMCPQGDEASKYLLGLIEIANDGTGTPTSGNYIVKLYKSSRYAKSSGIWRQARFGNFPRRALGPYDLLLCALTVALGNRLPRALRLKEPHP